MQLRMHVCMQLLAFTKTDSSMATNTEKNKSFLTVALDLLLYYLRSIRDWNKDES